MYDLTGKTALVTGGGRGIGRAIALELAAAGALTAVHYGNDAASAEKTVDEITAAGGRAFALRADLAEPDGPARLIAALRAELARFEANELDILVNNAGVVAPTDFEAYSPEDYDRVFAINTKALFFLTQGALPLLADGGRIVNISSGATRIAFPQDTAYAMSKGAVETLTLALAKHLGPRGITVNSVAPGVVGTDMNASWLRGNPEVEAEVSSWAALGRVGVPEDIAGPVLFLASEAGRWTTGTTVDATGGSGL
ncbi:SDR family oxidoreductase [Glycomyces halotolerans]